MNHRQELLIAGLIGVTALLALGLAVQIAVTFAQAGTRLQFHCDGPVGVYSGHVSGQGVLAINPYDQRCSPDPTYKGDSQPQ